MDLHTLSPARGSRKARKRLGRGEASGHGKTSGKGHKGQKARAGASIPAYFEGGQMPLYRRIRKIGFHSFKKREGINVFQLVPLSFLNKFSDGDTVDAEAIGKQGLSCSSRCGAGYKIVGNGTLEKKLTVKLIATTATARQAIEEKGGTIVSSAE